MNNMSRVQKYLQEASLRATEVKSPKHRMTVIIPQTTRDELKELAEACGVPTTVFASEVLKHAVADIIAKEKERKELGHP